VDADLSSLPDDLDALKAALIAARTEAAAEKACAVAAVAELAQGRALIAHLNLEIEKLRRTIYGPRSERTARLLDQLELQLEEAEANAAEDELAAEHTKPSTTVRSFARKRPARKPFPDHLPRERVVIPAPQSYPCCGSAKLSKLGEDIAECPSSDDLGHFVSVRKGGSGSSRFDVMRPAGDAASGGLRWFGV
jgi:hypothetical protein